MARSTLRRPDPRPSRSWDAVPVATGTHRRVGPWVAAAVAVAVTALVAAILLPLLEEQAPRVPGPPPPPPVGAAPAFDVSVRVTGVTPMDDDGLFGGRPPVAEGAVVDAVAGEIDAVVTEYLDTAFAVPATRFSDAAVTDLLSERALEALAGSDRAGLGVLDASLSDIEPEPVTVTARIVTMDGTVALVAGRYEARARVTTDRGGTGRLEQRAAMVFVPFDGGWRVDVVHADLTLPPGVVGGDR